MCPLRKGSPCCASCCSRLSATPVLVSIAPSTGVAQHGFRRRCCTAGRGSFGSTGSAASSSDPQGWTFPLSQISQARMGMYSYNMLQHIRATTVINQVQYVTRVCVCVCVFVCLRENASLNKDTVIRDYYCSLLTLIRRRSHRACFVPVYCDTPNNTSRLLPCRHRFAWREPRQGSAERLG